MSTVVDTLRKLTGRSSDVVERLSGLDQAVEAARGRLDDDLVTRSSAIVERAGNRLRLSSEHTVVALGGATGSGKSSLFNALCDLDLAAVGVKRPTTSWALACAWGEGAGELLDWLEIPKRHQVNRTGMLDETAADRELHGLVLLDMPDHDSTEVSHHLEVERLVKLADVLIWVLDPQKYADAAIHDRYLRPLHAHADVMIVALNHIDEVPDDSVQAALADVHRLLELDGLGTVPVIGTSARRGDGLPALRRAIADRVSDKKVARERLTADIRAAAAQIGEQTGDARPGDLRKAARGELLDACADAAGVPVMVESIQAASLVRGRVATGWPLTSWMSALRPDPMKKLKLADSAGDKAGLPDLRALRARMPIANSVQRARVDSAVRAVADGATDGMAPPWEHAVRTASVARLDEFSDALDDAIARTDMGVGTNPWWWGATRFAQWALFIAAVTGGLWLALLAFFQYLGTPDPSTPEVSGVLLPAVLLVGGLAAGVALTLIGRVAVRLSARRRAQRADDRLRGAIALVTDQLVVGPMQAEVDAYVACRDGAAAALKR